jgi:hypothetical protein
LVADFCCVCVHSLIPFGSSIDCSVCETYRPKFAGDKDIKLSILNYSF